MNNYYKITYNCTFCVEKSKNNKKNIIYSNIVTLV